MRNAFRLSLLVLSLFLVGALPGAAQAGGSAVVVNPDPSGWVCLPPEQAQYVAFLVDMFHSLPDPGWKADASHHRFVTGCKRVPGGSLGGDVETFDSTVSLRVVPDAGGASLAGFPTVDIPVRSETHTSRQEPGMPRQVLTTTMWSLEGRVDNAAGWKYFAVTAGDSHGLPSPGSTTLTRLPDGRVAVESHFTIRYRVEYEGAEGGPYAGLVGSGEGEAMMRLTGPGGGGPGG